MRTKSGWRTDTDAVASNGDIVHTYRDLVTQSKRGERATKSLMRKKYSPSLFVVHFGIKGKLAGHPAPHDPVRAAL